MRIGTSRLQIGLGICLFSLVWFSGYSAVLAQPHATAPSEPDIAVSDPPAAAANEAVLVSDTRQLTFEGRRAGEGYFSRDGLRMVFQSEREGDNPFFQIYLMDFDTGDVERVSPGNGKTTCGWIHPDGQQVLFASTHDDPRAREKQQEEFELRESGQQRRYTWDYDEHYEIYRRPLGSDTFQNLTNTLGYDAEGSWSPDGRLIAFASNRRAYVGEMTEAERNAFAHDPASMMDIYVMDSDGGNVRRLTDAPGYDGGPFFSPDGRRICWRRFSIDGAIAEIWTMNVDGSDARQLTRMGAMSWAPFYHPSSEYLIFTTNRHGFANFELYLVDAAAKSTPVRVTYTQGFDGLPAFSPDGKQLTWTSNRTASKQSQLFLASWNHEEARRLLGLGPAGAATADAAKDAVEAAQIASRQTTAQFSPVDIMRHVDYLCRPELEGRLTGTQGEQMATAYVAAYLDYLGLQPAGDDGTFFQSFPFTSGVALGDKNQLHAADRQYKLQTDWIPVSFSQTGDIEAGPVVFAGYGIVAPAEEAMPQYDSFVHLDVQDKWVLAYRFLPEQVAPERRQHLSRYASLRYKAMVARDKGARGLILVNGPNSQARQPLIPLGFDGSLAGTGVPVISVTNQVAEGWLAAADKSLKTLQDALDTGEPMMGFVVTGVEVSAEIDIEQTKRAGRNVLARLAAGDQPTAQSIVIGAHVDHLGKGPTSSSLARDDERQEIHFGADDNASGVAALLEIAAYASRLKAAGKWPAERDVLFAAWSGEELGLIGSSHFVKNRSTPTSAAHGSASDSLYPHIPACLNLDMVGRLDKRLILQGIGSSSAWPGLIERANAPVGLPVTLQEDSYLPTDASSFYVRGVPILSAFTGSHSEYHTPRDTPDTLNYEGTAKIARLMALIARSLATAEQAPDYVAQARPAERGQRAGLRAYLGTIPDYAEGDVKGLKLSGVGKDGPAEKAGVRAGDLIVELAGKKIENIYDYTYAIEALKIGVPVKIVVQRGDERITLEVTPGSRD
ncbi:MAG: M28 family peptidase [Pirellulaceae bacterium]|nr:M28 family peptidase [Pirellulaceae bacterium]